MARRNLPPTQRIFIRKRSAPARLAGTLILAMALGATVFGIGTGVYLNRPHAQAGTAAGLPLLPAARPAAATTAEHDPLAAAAAVPNPAERQGAATPTRPAPEAAALAKIEPQAGASAEPAGQRQTAALEQPQPRPVAPAEPAEPAAPLRGAAAAHYWVEYGVFDGPAYAKRLQHALAERGLASVVVTSEGHGRKLLRVRSTPLASLALARQAALTAHSALAIAPLIHHGRPGAGVAPAHYWVQFAAFRKPAPAARLQRRLARNGVGATVSSVRGKSGKPFYLVRSNPLATHAEAMATAARGRQLTSLEALVGMTPERAASHHSRAAPRPVAASR